MKKYKGLSTILLIDDDEATNFLTEFTIQRTKLSVEIEKVYNAQEGLDFIQCKGKYEHQSKCDLPQLIFLDINMPGLDGWDFIEMYRQLKLSLKLNAIIVILTTSQNPDDRLKAEQFSEVKEFVNKPLTKEIVVSIVGKYFEIKKA